MFLNTREAVRRPQQWVVGLGLMLLLLAVPGAGWLALAAPKVTLQKAWGPPLPPVASINALYMIIRNAGDSGDTLRGAHAPACTSIELHESYQRPGGTMGMAMMGMRPVPGGVIDLPAQGQVELKASDFHLRCIGKRKPCEKMFSFLCRCTLRRLER
jgi:copper(I)-binding protein